MSEVISTDMAPKAIGPYSQAVKAGDMLFISGQLGIDPQSSSLVTGGVEAEASQAMKNLLAILEKAGGDSSHLVKTTILLSSMDDFGKVNEIYKGFFSGSFPARACYEVSRLPAGGKIEIEAIAVIS